MWRRLISLAVAAVGVVLIAGAFWTLPHQRTIQIVGGMICGIYVLYEALRKNPVARDDSGQA